MEGFEPKRLAILRILDILKEYSDINHPLTQEEIRNLLEKNYGISIERKAVGRNISLLRGAGYDIEPCKDGVFFNNQLIDDSELHLIIDSILASKHISSSQSKSLINRISTLSNKFFKKHIKNIYSLEQRDKTDSKDLFLNIEVIDEAIQKEKQVKYSYNKFGTDKKLHKTSTQIISPYQLLLHNQRYYLMGRSNKWGNLAYHRVDKITDIEITDLPIVDIRTIEGYENGIDYKMLSTQMPYFNSTEFPETIKFYADEGIVDQIVDWFGKDVIFEEENDRIKVTLKSVPTPTMYWLLQYIEHIEVIESENIKNRIKDILKANAKKYK